MSAAAVPLRELGYGQHVRSLRRGGGELTWAAAVLISSGTFAAAVASSSREMFWASALCTVLAGTLAIRPDIGIMAVLLARPSLDVFQNRQFADVGSIGLNPASALAVLVIVVGGAYVIERWRDVRSAPAIWPFLAFATITFAGIAIAPSKGGAATEWLRLLSIIITYALTFAVVQSRRDLRRVIAVILLSVVVPVGVGAWQTAHGGSIVIADFNRATGTFLHPDPFGIFLAVVMLFALPLMFTRRLSYRPFLWLAAPVAGFALVGSYTRTAWVGMVFGLLVIATLRYRSLLVLAPLALVLVVAAVPAISHRFADLSRGHTQYGAGNSLAARVELWRQNLPRVKQKPILGEGFKAIVETDKSGYHVHSDYVRALVETGGLGFIAFLWLLFATGRGCLRSFRSTARGRDPAVRAAALGSLTTFAAWVLMSADSNLMTQVAVAGTAWAVFALGHAASRLGTLDHVEAR
jgi:putative inorganic carbon (HCO3(-)) transporter